MERRLMMTSALMFAVATFLLWGTNNFLMSYAEKQYGMDPKLFTAVMWMAMGAMGVVLFALLKISGHSIELNWKLGFPLVCGVLLGIGILTFSFAMSDKGMETGATAAVATSNAVFTAILAYAFLREDLSAQQWVGIGTVVLGIILLRI
jgi:drug/metabolite transporter (DMT)-like permease